MIKTYHQLLNKFNNKVQAPLDGLQSYSWSGSTLSLHPPPIPYSPHSQYLRVSCRPLSHLRTSSFLDDLCSSPHLNLLFIFFIILISIPLHWNYFTHLLVYLFLSIFLVVCNDYEERDHDCGPALISST